MKKVIALLFLAAFLAAGVIGCSTATTAPKTGGAGTGGTGTGAKP